MNKSDIQKEKHSLEIAQIRLAYDHVFEKYVNC